MTNFKDVMNHLKVALGIHNNVALVTIETECEGDMMHIKNAFVTQFLDGDVLAMRKEQHLSAVHHAVLHEVIEADPLPCPCAACAGALKDRIVRDKRAVVAYIEHIAACQSVLDAYEEGADKVREETDQELADVVKRHPSKLDTSED